MIKQNKASFALYPFQEEVVKTVLQLIEQGKSVIILMPYGTGKTVVALEILRRLYAKNKKDILAYTSGGAGGTERVQQATVIANELNYTDLTTAINYTATKHISRQDQKMLKELRKFSGSKAQRYGGPALPSVSTAENSTLLFHQVTRLRGMLTRQGKWSSVKLLIIDEIDEIIKNSFDKKPIFVVNVQFEEIFNEVKKNHFPVIGMTGCQDLKRLEAVKQIMGISDIEIVGRDVKPLFTYEHRLIVVRNEPFVPILNILIRGLMQSLITSLFSIARIDKHSVSQKFIYNFIYTGLPTLKVDRTKENVKLFVYDEYHNNTIELSFTVEEAEQVIRIRNQLFILSQLRTILLNSTADHFFERMKETLTNLKLFDKVLEDDIITSFQEFLKQNPSYDQGLLKGGKQEITRIMNEFLVKIGHHDEWYQIIFVAWVRLYKSQTHPMYGKLLSAVFETKRAVEQEGKQVVLMTRYIKMAETLEKRIKELCPGRKVACVTGKQPSSEERIYMEKREVILQQFRERKIDVLIVNQIGYKGFDLKTAKVIIHVDINSNPEKTRQMSDRIRGGTRIFLVYENANELEKIHDYIMESKEPLVIEEYKKLQEEEKQFHKTKNPQNVFMTEEADIDTKKLK